MGLNMLPNNPDRSHAHNYVINNSNSRYGPQYFAHSFPHYFVAHVRRGTCIYTLIFQILSPCTHWIRLQLTTWIYVDQSTEQGEKMYVNELVYYGSTIKNDIRSGNRIGCWFGR